MTTDLHSLREEIDRIDQEIISLLARRFQCTEQSACIKRAPARRPGYR
ncbi:chorismate mutase [Paenibacillus hexagrammi]|uniref:Chorismate mutase n=1 Tax=Paenibacillus hexagrammi TaxID=2908839 RepID=A0ABY3SHP4_9BACL|nr:chorismate mutase [Paenibacillus sp. YPD9-1]UJF33562.1 chorismate mutase [Paenibacillus sp. YPD9-1]